MEGGGAHNREFCDGGVCESVGADKIISGAPNWIELFNEITAYVSDLRKSSESSEPASKKRKIDSELPLNPKGVSNGAAATNGSSQNGGAAQAGSREEGPSLLQIQDISFTLPVRKKLTVEFTTTHIKVLDNKTKEVIPGASSYAWKDIGMYQDFLYFFQDQYTNF